MNTATLIPESPALLIDAPPKFNIVIIYEDADAGRRARRFSDTLLREMRDECHCVRNLWSFDVLDMTNIRNAAASAAQAADLVILSASGQRELPPHLEGWLDLWVWLIDGNKPALVGLFENADGGCAQGMRRSLRARTVGKKLEFFPHTTFEPEASFVCAEREHLAGSSRWHFNPARTAGAGAMAAQPGREHPGCVAGTPMGRFS
ncbi:MAG: hypothetical protein P4L99_27450 [Chthoniobacter sp.]|nr:hypothetical protein [Chthoniobacter sp.]